MKRLLVRFKKYLTIENCVVIISFLIFLFIYSRLFTNKILTSGDSWYLPQSFIKEYIPSFWYDSYSTGGLYPLTFTQIPIFFIFNGLYKLFNIDYNLGVKILFYFPFLIISVISGFLVSLKMSKDKVIASLVFLFFSTNTYILSVVIGSTPLIALSYSLMPLSLYFFHKFFILKSYKKYEYLLNGIFFGLIILLDIRYAHIFAIFIVLFLTLNYFLNNISLNIRELFKFILLFIIGIMIVNLFWILPYRYSGNELISLPANYDNPNWINVNTVNDYVNLFSIKHAYWPNILDGVKNNIEWYWLIFFILMFFNFIIYKKENKQNNYMLLILVSSILFLGSNFIFKDFNTWIFSNVPSFNIQRDPFKYFVLIILSIYMFIVNLKIYTRNIKILLLISFIFPILISIDMNYGLFKEKEIPKDFIELNEILSMDKSLNKTLWIPYKHRYGEFNTNKPTLQYIDFQSYGFLNLTKSDENVINNKDKFSSLLNYFGIKYLIIPYDPMNEWDSQVYSNMLEKNKYLDILLSMDNLNYIPLSNKLHLFINNQYKSIIESEKISYNKINSSKYILNISSSGLNNDLYFLQTYHNNWKLYLKPINSNTKDCNVIQEYNNDGKNIKECEHTQKFFEGEELSYLWKKPIFEDTHQLVYDYANQWTIDPEYIKANYDNSYYKENPDGSIDIELTLYFKPQSYFYLGIIISGTTLILCLGYLGYDFWENKNNKSDKDKSNLIIKEPKKIEKSSSNKSEIKKKKVKRV